MINDYLRNEHCWAEICSIVFVFSKEILLVDNIFVDENEKDLFELGFCLSVCMFVIRNALKFVLFENEDV